jgi:hypothetical protein
LRNWSGVLSARDLRNRRKRMNRGLLLCALAVGLTLPAGARAATIEGDTNSSTTTSAPEVVLETASIGAALLPLEPSVVTDAELANVGASPGVQTLTNDPNQLVVDDDLAQCPNADFTTATGIQQAIEAAAPGAKIRVCPGTYSPINVHKADLWLQAPRTQGNANGCREGNPTQDAVIAGANASGLVQIVGTGVRFEGFVVQGNTAGPGIRTDSTGSGYKLVFNEIRANQSGIDLNTNGSAETLVEHNCIRDNVALNMGILSSAGFSNVGVEYNFFSGHRCSAIANIPPATAAACLPTPFVPAADVTFSHNSLVDDTTAGFVGAMNVVVNANVWRRPFGASVVLEDVVGAEVSFNHIDGQNQALTQGIFIRATPTFPEIPQRVVVKSNKVENLLGGVVDNIEFFGTAISVNAPGVVVRENRIEFNKGFGIVLRVRSDGDLVHGNLLVGNGIPGGDRTDGIRLFTGAVGNLIENNRLGEPLQGQDPEERANKDHDCHDDNPSGANVWRHNVGYTENQPGLCVKRA